jgi:site-specific DNA-methyltransferase (adenine-specific)
VPYVAESIKQFGFKVPIVIDSNNVIVCGHTRYKAAKKLKLKTVPCIIADDLNEEQIKAFRLADNKVGELAEWDLDILKLELDDISNIDMTDFSFDLNSLTEEAEQKEVIEDDFDEEPPVEPRAKLGDIYQLGNHRLMCGDSTSAEDVEKLMNGDKADMVFTDPPYGVSYEGGCNEKKKQQIKNDSLSGNSLYQFLSDVFSNIHIFSKEKSAVYVFYATKTTQEFVNAFIDNGLKLRTIIAWYKQGGGFGDFMAHYMSAYEPCLYGSNGESVNWYGPTNEKTVWEIEKEKKCDLHPTMKPIKVPARAISNSSLENDIVLDLFGGSGSTLIACEQLNRNCYVMELDPKYIDVIIARWEKFTGKKAVKLN